MVQNIRSSLKKKLNSEVSKWSIKVQITEIAIFPLILTIIQNRLIDPVSIMKDYLLTDM